MRRLMSGVAGLVAVVLSASGAIAGSPYTQRTSYYVTVTVNEIAGTALFDDQSPTSLTYKNGYTFINDYFDSSTSDQQFFAPGARSFKLDISGSSSEGSALNCGMYGGKDSSVMTTGASFFQVDTSTADTSLKCATPNNELYQLSYTDCVQVTKGTSEVGRGTYTFSASDTCTPVIKLGRKVLSSSGVSVPFSITAELST